MAPLVSIIIPTYNRAHLITDTLDSILTQTYTNWECIVVDDGSCDDTSLLMETYLQKDNRFQYHQRPDYLPKGANACRNYGFEKSSGNYINWFDSDDIMKPNKLERQIQGLTQSENAPYCICQSLWFDKDNNKSLGLRSKAISSSNRFEDYCLYRIFWLTSAPLWRRDFIERHAIKFDITLQQSQEYDFHIKALSISDAYITIDEPLVTIVRHSEAISHDIYSNNEKLVSNLKVKKRLFDIYSHKLSKEDLIEMHGIITLNFKQLLLLKNYKMAYVYLIALFSTLKYINVPIYKKFFFSVRLAIIFISYRIFGRGYNLVRPLNKIQCLKL